MASDTASDGSERLRPRAKGKRLEGDDEPSQRFFCPEPGCKRTFAELWRLKVHCRASPDVRGSGRERGHGKELAFCPKCHEALQPGKHHIGCSAGRSAPRQAAKRLKSTKASSYQGAGHDLDLSRRHSSGSLGPRNSSASSNSAFWQPSDLGSPSSRGGRQGQSRLGRGSEGYDEYQAMQFQSAYAQALAMRPGAGGMERHASAPSALPRFQPFEVAGEQPEASPHGMGHFDPSLLQAAQMAAAPTRMESKGSSDLEVLHSLSGHGSNPSALLGSAYGGRSLSVPHSSHAPPLYGSAMGGGGPQRPAPQELASQLLQQSWALQFGGGGSGGQQGFSQLQRSSAFENGIGGLGAGRVLSPQPRYPVDGAGQDGGSDPAWNLKAAAAAAARAPFSQNAAAIRFLEQQHKAQQSAAASAPASHFMDMYASAAEMVRSGNTPPVNGLSDILPRPASGSNPSPPADLWGALAASGAAMPAGSGNLGSLNGGGVGAFGGGGSSSAFGGGGGSSAFGGGGGSAFGSANGAFNTTGGYGPSDVGSAELDQSGAGPTVQQQKWAPLPERDSMLHSGRTNGISSRGSDDGGGESPSAAAVAAAAAADAVVTAGPAEHDAQLKMLEAASAMLSAEGAANLGSAQQQSNGFGLSSGSDRGATGGLQSQSPLQDVDVGGDSSEATFAVDASASFGL